MNTENEVFSGCALELLVGEQGAFTSSWTSLLLGKLERRLSLAGESEIADELFGLGAKNELVRRGWVALGILKMMNFRAVYPEAVFCIGF